VNAGYADLAAGYTITWAYNPSIPGNTQTGYILRAKIAGAGSYVFWNQSISAWQSGTVLNAQTVNDAALPAGAFQDGVVYNIAVATADVNGTGPFCADITATSLAAPTATVTAPGGTVTTSLPTVTWTPGLPSPSFPIPVRLPSTYYAVGAEIVPSVGNGCVYRCVTAGTTDPTASSTFTSGWSTSIGSTIMDGTVTWEVNLAFASSGAATITPVQTSYRVIIYSSTQYTASGFTPGSGGSVFDTGQVASAVTWSVPVTTYLADGTLYRAYVQITESGGSASTWAYSSFVTSFTAPAQPSFSANGGSDYVSGAPLVNLSVTGHDTGSLRGNVTAMIEYSDNQGGNWYALRNGTAVLPYGNQNFAVADREVPSGFTRLYRCLLVGTVSGSTVSSTWVQIQATSPSRLVWWLKDPLTQTAIPLSLAPGTFETVATDRQQVVPVLTRPDPVVLSDTFGLPQITCNLVFIGDAAYQAFEAMRATQHILLLQGPYPAGQWYVRLGDTKNDSTNLPSLRYLDSTKVVRNVTLTAQAVAAP
jgi:hypothetical protein